MRRVNGLGIGWLACLACAAFSVARSGRAEQPNPKATPIYVLQILTDDSDDQAESLTQAIRARVRQVHGWSLAETPQSLETLTIALKCPPKPDAACLQRIGDQLRADHYVWGMMARKKAGEVNVAMHLWNRGKPENEVAESYSENLKDPTEDGLRAVAARVLEGLTGATPGGALVIHAGTGGGSVLVDGVTKGALSDGVAHIDVTEGAHAISVRVPGFEAPALSIKVKAGVEQEVGFALAPAKPSSAPESESGEARIPVREILGYAALAAGVGLFTGATIEGLNWLADKNASDNDRKSIPSTVTDVCVNPTSVTEQDACSKSKDATTKATIGWIFLGAGAVLGATGVWLITTDHSSSSSSASSSARRVPPFRLAVAPILAPNAAAVRLEGSF